MEYWRLELESIQLEDAVNNGRYSDVESFCHAHSLHEASLELVALAQIKWLTYGSKNFTSEGVAIWNSPEIRQYLMTGVSAVAIEKPVAASLHLGSRQKVIIALIDAMQDTIGYHVEMGDSQRYDPGRRVALDLFLSEAMDHALRDRTKDPDISDRLAHLTGTSYHCIFVTSAMHIIPLEDFRVYVERIKKWESHLADVVQLNRTERGANSWSFQRFGEFDSTIGFLGITQREVFDQLREVVDATLETAKNVYGDVIEVSKQVGSWLSYIPDDETKSYIRLELLRKHGLDSRVLDANTTPTETFLFERLQRTFGRFMDHYGPIEYLLQIVRPEDRPTVSHAMIQKIRGANEYDLTQVAKMAPYVGILYDEGIVSSGFKEIVLDALKRRDARSLRLLAPFVPVFYKGSDLPDHKKLV